MLAHFSPKTRERHCIPAFPSRLSAPCRCSTADNTCWLASSRSTAARSQSEIREGSCSDRSRPGEQLSGPVLQLPDRMEARDENPSNDSLTDSCKHDCRAGGMRRRFTIDHTATSSAGGRHLRFFFGRARRRCAICLLSGRSFSDQGRDDHRWRAGFRQLQCAYHSPGHYHQRQRDYQR